MRRSHGGGWLVGSLFFAGSAFAGSGAADVTVKDAPLAGVAVQLHAQPAPPRATPDAAATPQPQAAVGGACRPPSEPRRGLDARPVCRIGPGAPSHSAASGTEASVTAPTWQETAADEPGRKLPSGDGPTRWYGWQILLSDAASVVVIAAGANSDDPAFKNLAYLGVAGYLAAPPIIHAAHGQTTRALASVGLRSGLPVGGAIIGAIASSGCYNVEDDDGYCQLGYAAVGFLAGIVGAMAIDMALASEPAPREPTASGLRLAPQLLVSQRETRVGLTGSF